MKSTIKTMVLAVLAILYGCSNETPMTGAFKLPAGASITFVTQFQSTDSDSGVYFALSGIPETRTNRDYTDYMSLELIDDVGKSHRPENIRDINGSRRDIVASCNNLPRGLDIQAIKLVALKDLEGSKIRLWSGKLK
jgi:hypothetical protein